METKRQKLNVNEKIIPNILGHSQPRWTQTKIGGSIKIGCKYKFLIKQLYYYIDIAEIVCHNLRHAKNDRLIIHNEI